MSGPEKARFYDLFQSSRERLRQLIASAPSAEAGAKVLGTELEALLRALTSGGRLSGYEASIATYLIDLARLSVQAVAVASLAEVWQKDETPGANGELRRESVFDFWTLVTFVEALLAGLALFLIWDPKTKTSFALLAAAIAAGVARAANSGIRRWSTRLHEHSGTRAAKPASMGLLKLDADLLIPRVAEVLLHMDKVLALIREKPSDRKHTSEADSGMLEFHQDLLEARETADGDYAMKKLRLLPRLLEAQGIQAVAFDGGNADYFDFRPTLDTSLREPKTIRPAFIRERTSFRTPALTCRAFRR